MNRSDWFRKRLVRRDKKILSFPFLDFLGLVGRKKKFFPEKKLHVILGGHKGEMNRSPEIRGF